MSPVIVLSGVGQFAQSGFADVLEPHNFHRGHHDMLIFNKYHMIWSEYVVPISSSRSTAAQKAAAKPYNDGIRALYARVGEYTLNANVRQGEVFNCSD